MTASSKTERTRLHVMLLGGLGLGLGLTLLLDAAMLVVPLYDMQLYDRVLQSRNMDTLAMLSIACAVGLVLYALVDYLRSACFLAIGEAMGRRLNGLALHEGVRQAAAGDRQAGARLVRDLAELQGFLTSGAVAVPLDALCAPVFIWVLFQLNPAFAFVAIGGIAALVLVGLLTEMLIGPALLAAQAGRADAAHALSRSLAEHELAEGLGMLPAIARFWAARHGRALTALDRVGAQALVLAGLSRLVRMAAQVAMMTVGALLVLAGAATPGSLMGANLLGGKALQPFDHLVGSWRHWALAIAAWRRIDGLLCRADAAAAASHPVQAEPGLRVCAVSFHAADGRALLDGIELSIPPGSLVAVTGPNGAGKTTLLRLLAGLSAPSAGQVLLDGAPVHGGPGVGFLPQSVALLDGSIADNITRFEPGDRLAEMVAAARLAEVHELVGRMGRGYDTGLAGNGASLSGGMRQRVGLARAIFGTPRLLVLDEPDASLDADGTRALLQALRACCDGGAIAVVTSHRPGVQAAADIVVELRDGALATPAPRIEAAPAIPRGAPASRLAYVR